jgi:hypothetical protein
MFGSLFPAHAARIRVKRKTYFMWASWRSLTNKVGSGTGSVSQLYGFADPYPFYKMSLTLQHWLILQYKDINLEITCRTDAADRWLAMEVTSTVVKLYRWHHTKTYVMSNLEQRRWWSKAVRRNRINVTSVLGNECNTEIKWRHRFLFGGFSFAFKVIEYLFTSLLLGSRYIYSCCSVRRPGLTWCFGENTKAGRPFFYI